MRNMIIVVTGFIACAYVCHWLVRQWHKAQDVARYEETTRSLLCFANELRTGGFAVAPECDAWGGRLSVVTNAAQIVYVSNGANSEDPSDDITLRIETESCSYSVSYSYNSYHFTSAVTYD